MAINPKKCATKNDAAHASGINSKQCFKTKPATA
jgi:hypothetical protein